MTMEAENIVCISKLVKADCNNSEGAQQHYQNMETDTNKIVTGLQHPNHAFLIQNHKDTSL